MGTYALSNIKTKLDTNEIGMLHEILVDGGWLTLRDFQAQQRLVMEEIRIENERASQAEKAQAESERAIQQKRELLLDEKRRTELMKIEQHANNKHVAILSNRSQTPTKLMYVAIITALVLVSTLVYIVISSRIEADRAAAEAVKEAAKAQEKAAALNAAASMFKTIVDGAVEANKPPPIIIQPR